MQSGADADSSASAEAPRLVTAQLGAACDEPGARACVLDDPRTRLWCKDAKWASQAICGMAERCESAVGLQLGNCVPIASECLNHAPGQNFCDGDFLRSCDNLVLNEAHACPDHRRCTEVNGAVECGCAAGLSDQGATGCQVATTCSADNGGCDTLTQCSISGGQPVCSPCPDGYEGRGETGCFAQLRALSIEGSALVLTPAFAPDVFSYHVKVPLWQQELRVATQAVPTVQIDIDSVDQVEGAFWQSPPLPLGEHKFEINLTTSVGRKSKYDLTIERAGAQEAYVKAAASDSGDEFGTSTAIWGDTLVVGAPLDDGASANSADNSRMDSGAVYVFVRNGNVWEQQAYLKASPTLSVDYFGMNVALREDLLAVGAPGGNFIASSTPHGGTVHIFKRQAGKWSFVTKLAPADTGIQDLFGQHVALDDNYLIVGAPLESTTQSFSGAVYVYPRTGDSFGQPQKLKSAQPLASGLFGLSLAFDADTLVVGAPQYNNTFSESDTGFGKAFVFTSNRGQWSQLQELEPAASLEEGATFGWTTTISGDTIVVGAPRARATNDGQAPGDAFVYERSAAGGTWEMTQALQATVPRASDWFGWAVKLSPTMLLVGSVGDTSSAPGLMGDPDSKTVAESGAVYMYGRGKDQWLPTTYIKASNPGTPDNFGTTVAIYGDTIVSSAPGEGSEATGVDGDQTNNNLSRAGAVYVFR